MLIYGDKSVKGEHVPLIYVQGRMSPDFCHSQGARGGTVEISELAGPVSNRRKA